MTTITVATTTITYTNDPSMELARLTLSVGVPTVINHLQRAGGPNDYQMDAARDYITRQRLGEAIMFVSRHETGSQMALLIECVAILAFCPGGVSVCGLRFEAKEGKR